MQDIASGQSLQTAERSRSTADSWSRSRRLTLFCDRLTHLPYALSVLVLSSTITVHADPLLVIVSFLSTSICFVTTQLNATVCSVQTSSSSYPISSYLLLLFSSLFFTYLTFRTSPALSLRTIIIDTNRPSRSLERCQRRYTYPFSDLGNSLEVSTFHLLVCLLAFQSCKHNSSYVPK